MALRAQHTSTQTTYHSLQRNIPARGFKPAYYMIGMHVIMAYGFYKYFHGAREQRYVSTIPIRSSLRSSRNNHN